MGRSGSIVVAVVVFLFLSFGLAGCSGGSSTRVVSFPTPGSIGLTPATTASMEIGTTLTFTGSPKTNSGTAISEPVSYHSSNSAVVTIADNGLACAGSWNSLSSPQICTPGPAGTALIYATVQGVSSPSTTVYVHQHIDQVVISPVASPTNPPASLCYSGAPTTPGYSKGLPANGQQYVTLEATAYSQGVDITSAVGQFSWSAGSSGTTGVVTLAAVPLTNPPTLNQEQVTANIPGVTSIYATADGVNSTPYPYLTCPVNSIVLSVVGNSGTSTSINAVAYDANPNIINHNGIIGFPITGIPLTWTSSQPLVAKVTGSSASTIYAGTATTAQGTTGGTATIIASCTPPTCNIGLTPALPIYPKTDSGTSPSGILNVTSTPTAAQSATLYVTSQDCGTTDSCFTRVIPISATVGTSGNGSTFTVGAPIALAATSASSGVTPNSLLFEPQGTKAYLGTERGDLGAKGLQVLTVSGTTVSHFPSTPGKVLAVSPDDSHVIVSDTFDQPNQVYLLSPGSGSSAPLIPSGITGAVAAAFSPDNLKAFVVTNTGNLYIYSALEALQTIPMGNPATDITFFPQGSFAYIAGGDPSSPSSVTVRRTCDNTIAENATFIPQILTTPGLPSFIRALPNGTGVVAVDSPGIDLITLVSDPFNPAFDSDGCSSGDPSVAPPVPPSPNVNNSVASFNFGQGSFLPVQIVVSEDSSTVYIVADDASGQQPLPVVLAFNVNAKTFSAISLTANAIPLQIALTQDRRYLFVGAKEQSGDPTVHVLDMVSGGDIDQLVLDSSHTAPICVGPGNPGLNAPVTCYPDLMAVAP
jgi:hypothetical protein